jgi:putative DNA methylase
VTQTATRLTFCAAGKNTTSNLGSDDIFQERLYCIQWMAAETLNRYRPSTYFASVTKEDSKREDLVQAIVGENFARWQDQGFVPDMIIEPGEKTDEPIRTRGWTYWHHLFHPRQLLLLAQLKMKSRLQPTSFVEIGDGLNYLSKLCGVKPGGAGSRPEEIWIGGTFTNQALNTLFNFGVRSFGGFPKRRLEKTSFPIPGRIVRISDQPAREVATYSDLFITDPPYADAVMYHEITEFFIAWLRKKPPSTLQ